MKKFSTVFLSFFFGVIAATAQGPAKAIFFELGGPGLASINYDMRFYSGFSVGYKLE